MPAHASTRLSRAFRLRLLTALAGCTRERFFKDAGSGLTAGIVALPLATAFAVASGLKPQAGIWTAVIAGALISALGGSAVPIGRRAGAFIFDGAAAPWALRPGQAADLHRPWRRWRLHRAMRISVLFFDGVCASRPHCTPASTRLLHC